MNEEFTMEKIQELEFDLLKFLKSVCQKYNLNYFLAYGTLIGAARHQDFIPWDDDVDVMIPREDYHKLIKAIEKESHPYYKIISYETNQDFTVPLPKLVDTRTKLVQKYDIVEKVELGIYIDLFIIDGVGDSLEKGYQYYDESLELYKLWKKSALNLFPPKRSKLFGIIRWLKNIYYKCRGSKYYIEKIQEHNSKYSFYQSEYVATLETGTGDSKKCVWPHSYFGEGTNLKIKNEYFNAPDCYDLVLKSEYGDYMQLPPLEARKSHHSYSLEWR